MMEKNWSSDRFRDCLLASVFHLDAGYAAHLLRRDAHSLLMMCMLFQAISPVMLHPTVRSLFRSSKTDNYMAYSISTARSKTVLTMRIVSSWKKRLACSSSNCKPSDSSPIHVNKRTLSSPGDIHMYEQKARPSRRSALFVVIFLRMLLPMFLPIILPAHVTLCIQDRSCDALMIIPSRRNSASLG